MDEGNYDTFRLNILQDNTIEAILTTYDRETRSPTTKVAEDKYLREDIDSGISMLKKGELDRPDDIRRLGRDLYRALFPDTVGELFERALDNVLVARRGQNKSLCLRVIVDVHPKSQVFAWPLEFLYCPSQKYWLGTEKPAIALSRHATFAGTIDFNRQRPPLRVLVVISKPNGLGGVMTTKVLQELGKLAASAEESGGESKRMEVKVLGADKDYERTIPGIDYLDQRATYVNIRETTGGWKPQVFHFIGHGKLEGDLGLVDDDGEVDWCSANDFSQLFSDWCPRLVLLQACESAASGTEPGFMSLAAHLVQRHIQAVIAMQFAIRNDDATQFATGFYKALRHGSDVDVAVQAGRWKLSDQPRHKNRHFGAPVLFMYSPEGIVQPLSGKVPRSVSGQYEQPEGSGASRPAMKLDSARDMIEKALHWLGEEGFEEDQELAGKWMERACTRLGDEGRSEAKTVQGALECLGLNDADGARKRLRQAHVSLGMQGSVGRAAKPALQSIRSESEGRPDITLDSWSKRGGVSLETTPALSPSDDGK